MITNTKLVLAAAIILGAASAALANDYDFTVSEGQAAREWKEFMSQNQNHMSGGTGYGYYASPTQQEDHSQSGKKSHNR